MKITDRYYVLVRLVTTPKGARMDNNSETVFLYLDDTIGADIKCAMQYNSIKTAKMFLENYERREYNGDSSGFVPLFVTREYTF